MSTLQEMAAVLRAANPDNKPMYLQWIAEQLSPGAYWLNSRPNHHNGGSRTGGRVAGGFCGRMQRAGLLRCTGDLPRSYTWVPQSKKD